MEGGSSDEDSFWCRRFRFGGLRVAIEEEFGSGLGGTVWGGAVALARHLSEAGGAVAAADELADAAPLVAIELGAGCCGLPSLVVAHYCGRFTRVIATDWCVRLLLRHCLLRPSNLTPRLRAAARCCHGCAKTSRPTLLVLAARLRWALMPQALPRCASRVHTRRCLSWTGATLLLWQPCRARTCCLRLTWRTA